MSLGDWRWLVSVGLASLACWSIGCGGSGESAPSADSDVVTAACPASAKVQAAWENFIVDSGSGAEKAAPSELPKAAATYFESVKARHAEALKSKVGKEQ